MLFIIFFEELMNLLWGDSDGGECLCELTVNKEDILS